MSGEGVESGRCVEFVLLVERLCVQKEECVCVCGCLVFLVGAFSGVWVWGVVLVRCVVGWGWGSGRGGGGVRRHFSFWRGWRYWGVLGFCGCRVDEQA